MDHALAHFPGAATMRARIAALRRFNVTRRLSEISAPTLISVAKDDVLVPWTCSQKLSEHLANTVWHCVAHGAHAHNITAADEFNSALLSFLESLPKGPTECALDD